MWCVPKPSRVGFVAPYFPMTPLFRCSPANTPTWTSWVCRRCIHNNRGHPNKTDSGPVFPGRRQKSLIKQKLRPVLLEISRRSSSSTGVDDVAIAQPRDLPSHEEGRRSHVSKKFSRVMDHLQSNIFIAGKRLNDLTGYSGIEALKTEIQEQGISDLYARP